MTTEMMTTSMDENRKLVTLMVFSLYVFFLFCLYLACNTKHNTVFLLACQQQRQQQQTKLHFLALALLMANFKLTVAKNFRRQPN